MSAKKIFQKVATLRIEGPINLCKQTFVLNTIPKLKKQNFGALAVIINSYGGPYSFSKGICEALNKFRDQQKIPIICFAEDFCLNSANMILTLGTKCYANKLSMIGDFGFVSESIDDRQMLKKHKIGRQLISGNKIVVGSANFQTINIMDKKVRDNFVNSTAKQMKEEIIKNRGINLDFCNKNVQEFEERVFSESIIEPYKAVEYGYLDGVLNFSELKEKKFANAKVKNFQEIKFENPYMNFIYALAQKLNPKQTN